MSMKEREYSQRLADSAKGVKNDVVRVVMMAVAQDSLKHSMIYDVLAELFREERSMIDEAELAKIGDEIEHHIRTEEEMIEYLKNLLNSKAGNKATKFLLEALLKDEFYHHALLKRVHEMIIRKEAFTESDLWEFVWKDVAFHGAPGG